METYHFKTLPPPCREEIQDHLSTKSHLMTFLSLHFLLLFQGAAGLVALWYLCYCLMHSNGSGDFTEKAKGGTHYTFLQSPESNGILCAKLERGVRP